MTTEVPEIVGSLLDPEVQAWGQPLALQEMMIGFDRILDRLDDIALAPGAELEHSPGLLFYALKELPIVFTAS